MRLDNDVMKDTAEYGNVVGLDMGCVHIFATSDGDIYDYSDTTVKALATSMKSYDSLFNMAREDILAAFDHVIVNSGADTISLGELVLPTSNRKGSYGKTWPRKVQRLKNSLLDDLGAMAGSRGVTLVMVNESYSSHECSGCGNISAESRITRGDFLCVLCNMWEDSDINAAKNIARRATDPHFVQGVMNTVETKLYLEDDQYHSVYA